MHMSGDPAVRERLRAMGIKTEEAPDARYFRGVRFTAPDGQQMELTTDGPGFSIDEEENELVKRLTLPSSRESRRAEIEERQPIANAAIAIDAAP